MDIAIACLICLIGGIVAGLIGVGGGVVFVPAMTVLLAMGQVEAEATSLMMIALVSVVGTWRQVGYGNVNLKDAAVIGLLSPVGVLIGVVTLDFACELLGAQQGHAATGHDAFLDRSTRGVQGVFDTSLLFLHLDFGGSTDLDDCDTAGQQRLFKRCSP